MWFEAHLMFGTHVIIDRADKQASRRSGASEASNISDWAVFATDYAEKDDYWFLYY